MQKISNIKTTKEQLNSTKNIAPVADESLHSLAFDNASQPSIISEVSSAKIIAANLAACKLLAYSTEELASKTICEILKTSDGSVEGLLKQSTAEGISTRLISAINKDGKLIKCQVGTAFFMDGDIQKAIISIVDMTNSISKQKNIDDKNKRVVEEDIAAAISKQKRIDVKKQKVVDNDIILAQAKSDKRLAENNEWIKYIAKTSYDVMWNWNIATGEIYVGDSIREVFGYKVKNNTVNFQGFLECLMPEETEAVQKFLSETLASTNKSWTNSYRFKRSDDLVAFTTSRASIIRDEEGKARRMIGATQDVSRLQELENKLSDEINVQSQSNENRSSFIIASYVLWEWNVTTNQMFYGEGFEELFGHAIQVNKEHLADWESYVHIDDRQAVKEGLNDAIVSSATQWAHAYRLIKADGSEAKVYNKANIFRSADGKAIRMIGVLQDISNPRLNTVDITFDKKSILVKKIKNVIVEYIRHSDEQLPINFSTHLGNNLQYDYTYLANLFSEVEGMPIQTFIIEQKIERVKELLTYDELNLTQIASKLHYSSVAHLSNQFKKVTGLTPSSFKQLKHERPAVVENV